MFEGQWNSTFSGMYSTKEANFMEQLLGNYSLPNDSHGISNFEIPGHGSTMNLAGIEERQMYYSSDDTNTNMYCFSPGTSSYSGGGGGSILFSTLSHESYFLNSQPFLAMDNSSVSIDFCNEEDINNTGMQVEAYANNQRKGMAAVWRKPVFVERIGRSEENPRWQYRKHLQRVKTTTCRGIPRKDLGFQEMRVQKKRKVMSKKNQKLALTSNNGEESNALHQQSSSSCCSEDDDSNGSLELNGGLNSSSNSKGAAALNVNGTRRAGRGSATDPQSLYARKRRERINKRLRVLQNLVPNGTKVDISTMLEEAVQYVKFLQLQIKLLSSDDLWMYMLPSHTMEWTLGLISRSPCLDDDR